MKKIFIDTDIGPDCDDAGALAIANRLHNEKKIELLGVTHCTSDIGGSYTVSAINQWFGNDRIMYYICKCLKSMTDASE